MMATHTPINIHSTVKLNTIAMITNKTVEGPNDVKIIDEPFIAIE